MWTQNMYKFIQYATLAPWVKEVSCNGYFGGGSSYMSVEKRYSDQAEDASAHFPFATATDGTVCRFMQYNNMGSVLGSTMPAILGIPLSNSYYVPGAYIQFGDGTALATRNDIDLEHRISVSMFKSELNEYADGVLFSHTARDANYDEIESRGTTGLTPCRNVIVQQRIHIRNTQSTPIRFSEMGIFIRGWPPDRTYTYKDILVYRETFVPQTIDANSVFVLQFEASLEGGL